MIGSPTFIVVSSPTGTVGRLRLNFENRHVLARSGLAAFAHITFDWGRIFAVTRDVFPNLSGNCGFCLNHLHIFDVILEVRLKKVGLFFDYVFSLDALGYQFVLEAFEILIEDRH